MRKSEINRVVYLGYWTALVLLAVCCWDIFVLKVDSWPFYYPFKLTAIVLFLLLSHLGKKEKINPLLAIDLYSITLYLYAFIGTLFLHSTYIFAFYEGIFIICCIYPGSLRRYSALTLFALALILISINYMPEPEFIREGFSFMPHLQTLTGVIIFLSFIVYWLFNRQRELIYKMDQRFASIGRQSAFLLHELKSPLNRFLVRNSEKDNRDAQHILSIVEGVELLISRKENINFDQFNWSEIKSYIEEEFHEICNHYKISFEIIGLDREGFGHRSAIKIALKNLIKNAVEAIVQEDKGGIIKIKGNGNSIEISNNGSLISQEQVKQIFQPFYSQKNKKTNYGIGLHFVESVIKAHDGRIAVEVCGEWNIFKIEFGEMI